MATADTQSENQDFISLKRVRSASLAQLTKLYNELEKTMSSYDNIEKVKLLYGKLCDRFEQFRSVQLQCLDLCTESEAANNLEQNFESCQKNFVEFQDRYSQWISERERPTPEDNDVCSDVSRISSCTSALSQSRLRSAKAKRLIAEHKLKKLSEKQALERAYKEMEQKQQLFEQQCEVEEATLEESVWQQAVNEDTIETTEPKDLHVPTTTQDICDNARYRWSVESETDIHPVSTVSTQTRVRSQSPKRNDQGKSSTNYLHSGNSDVSVTSINAAFQSLATTLHEGFNLPKPELLTFNGTPTDYCKFIKNFEANIENRISDDRLRLSYLIQYCNGEAKSCIEDCVLLEPSDGYKRARSILYSRYGRPYVITRSYIDELVTGPQIKASDIDGLARLALEMQKCEITLSQLGFSSDVDNSENLRRIVKRLPMHLRVKWVDIAHSINEPGTRRPGREPRFSDLAKFVDEKSRVANSMYGLDLAREKNDRNSSVKRQSDGVKVKVTTLATNSEGETERRDYKCGCCLGTCTDLASCEKFTAMNLNDRNKLVRKLRLCYNCLKGKHVSKTCRKPQACTVPDCKWKHHILLHSWVNESDHTAIQRSVSCAATNASISKNCLGIIPVVVKGGSGNSCQTYALLDDGADKSLCDERLLHALNVASRPVTFKISTVSSTGSTNHGQEVDLQVQQVNGKDRVTLRNVWSVKRLPISTQSTAVNADVKKLPYLTDIDIPRIDTKDVMLLIGTDSPDAHIPLEVRSGNRDQPYAIRTRLGWAIRGPIQTTSAPDEINVHFQQSSDALLQQQLERMWTTDFDDRTRNETNSMSVEDKRAMEIMESSIVHENGHYKIGLPWRDENTFLPNNRALAHARLQQLKRKLSRDSTLHQKYTETVNVYIAKGYAKEVNHMDTDSKRTWYLPHHPVINVNKPGKLRVVFDCAAKYEGISLNSRLLQGPDLMNSLVGVVIRFRQEQVALAADIEAMFHQVRVQEKDCDVLRFLWWPNGDLNQQPRSYSMQVHLFGATSSPSCAAYALKRTADDHADLFEPDVVSTVHRNFYVDDCLKSVPSEKGAVKLALDLQSLLKMGGFRLTKWLSNSRTVLNSIPESERAPSIVSLNPCDALPSDRALGINWDVNEDKIKFKVKIADQPLTRRGILSIVSSIFDPLGLVSPITLRAKAIVQNLCRQKLGWDDQIPLMNQIEWKNWLGTLPHLENVSVNRCFKPKGFGNITNAQLHLFSDGSELGYGACAYLRLVDDQDNITCTLVIGKSRLAPIKQMSIPRLELSGAVVSCRLYRLLTDEMELKLDQVTFWTDSMIVLGYIKNVSRRFKTFVGNRLSIIHDATSPDQWRHIESNSNPADIASRGIDASDNESLSVWLNGPDFIWHDSVHWPQQQLPHEVVEDDVEVRKETAINTTTSYFINSMADHYSDWRKLKRATAWLMRFKTYCKHRYLRHHGLCKRGNLTLTEIQKATNDILVRVQESSFLDEMTSLRNGKPVRTESRVAPLNPVLDGGLIRSKGRLSSGSTNTCPIILPSGHHVTTLIIRYNHETKGHVGIQHVLAAIRENYWILKGHSAVKKVIKGCIMCKRQHAPLCTQQMAPLLEEQMTPDKAPFSFVGIDYFGPLIVKAGRKHLKRYGCLFTCLTTRAVHLEVAQSLTANSFIAAFQRFSSRRGVPEKIYSDNGTNLVKGDSELRKSIQEWNKSNIEKHMTHHEIEWHFNPPYASHMGGVWERMIRSARTILKALAREQILTDEQLQTLMAEAERIMNDRPITPVSSDPNDSPALTPSMLLLMKSNTSIPQGVFVKEDVYAKRWWRQVQYLANVFWRRWIREYLPSLQARQKWQRAKTDIRTGDVVLVAEANTPRGQWPLGRVIDVKVGRDGHVRSCVIKTHTSQIRRPVTKLCLLEGSN